MDGLMVALSRWQFGLTTVYHFFFVPLTLGLSVLVALIQTMYVSTGREVYKTMARFWGKLFLINFALGVVTGIVQEFQFGMNWSEYSRYVGDIFGAPLAIEALLAFFLESIFLGVWVFGWDKLPKGVHLASIWLVAIGANISAFWILVANSFMQHPVGFNIDNGRMMMTGLSALLTNPYVWGQFPHTIFSGFTTAAFFVLGISAYHLYKRQHQDVFRASFSIASVFGIISIFLVILVGHNQAQRMVQLQPMKMASVEALWETADPASFSLFTIVDQENQRDIVSLRIPRVLSLLAYNRLSGRVEGILDLQKQYQDQYGAGNYVPNITVTYWTFRIMVGLGFLMFLIAAYALYRVMRGQVPNRFLFLNLFPFAIALPYLSNSTGWILTEMGRQPWVVYGYLKTENAASPTVSSGMVLTSLILFALVYGALMVVDAYLLTHFAKKGPMEEQGQAEDLFPEIALSHSAEQ